MEDNNTVEIRPRILEKLAIQFVDKFEEGGRDGEYEAGKWLYPLVEKHEYYRIKELIEAEFIRRGYSFPQKVD